MFQRLQAVKSDYDATKILQETTRLQKHKSRITNYQNGRPKQDPLTQKHKLNETISKKRLSTLHSLNRTGDSP